MEQGKSTDQQDFITFQDITFAYPPVDEEEEEVAVKPIFHHFTATLPGGFVSLVGPNASGKSTFMLLAAGRLLPQQGRIFLLGKDTSQLTEEARDLLASFIYQNMEFDTEEPVAQLLQQVYLQGAFAGSCQSLEGQAKDIVQIPSHCAGGSPKSRGNLIGAQLRLSL